MCTLQAAVNGEMKQVDDWLVSNKLALNCSKTKFQVITRSQEHKQIKINVVAGELNQVKYLGFRIYNQLKWQQQIDHVCKKLSCASYALRSCGPFHPSPILNKTV